MAVGSLTKGCPERREFSNMRCRSFCVLVRIVTEASANGRNCSAGKSGVYGSAHGQVSME
jgi:hypothetical protein